METNCERRKPHFWVSNGKANNAATRSINSRRHDSRHIGSSSKDWCAKAKVNRKQKCDIVCIPCGGRRLPSAPASPHHTHTAHTHTTMPHAITFRGAVTSIREIIRMYGERRRNFHSVCKSDYEMSLSFPFSFLSFLEAKNSSQSVCEASGIDVVVQDKTVTRTAREPANGSDFQVKCK